MFVVLGKDGCIFCERSVQMLKTFEVEYSYQKLDKDFTKDFFLEVVPKHHTTFPAIFKLEEDINTLSHLHGHNFVGGFTELKKVIFD